MDIWLEALGKSSSNLHDKKALRSFCLGSEQIPRPLQPMAGHRWESVNRAGKGRLGLPGAHPTLSEGNPPSFSPMSFPLFHLAKVWAHCFLFPWSEQKIRKKNKKAGLQPFYLHKHKYVSFSSDKGFPETVCLYVCVYVCAHIHYEVQSTCF